MQDEFPCQIPYYKQNPYQLAEDIDGIGFRIADEIASQIGIHTDSDYRIRSGILYTLLQAVGEGHCYLPREILLERARELLQVPGESIHSQIDNLAMDKKLVIKKDSIYAYTYYYAELSCARMLFDLSMSMGGDRAYIEKTVKGISKELDIETDELQLQAASIITHED